MDYPKMIYAGGELSGDYLIVQDEGEEAAAEKDGFWAHDRQLRKAPATSTTTVSDGPKPRGKPGPKPKVA